MEDTTNTIAATIENRNKSFAEYLFALIDEKNLTDPEVYKAANVGRKTFSDIRHGKIPTKKTIIKIIFALELSADKARVLLERAGYALSTSLDADLIVAHFIEQKIFDNSHSTTRLPKKICRKSFRENVTRQVTNRPKLFCTMQPVKLFGRSVLTGGIFMKKFLVMLTAVALIFAAGCGNSSNEKISGVVEQNPAQVQNETRDEPRASSNEKIADVVGRNPAPSQNNYRARNSTQDKVFGVTPEEFVRRFNENLDQIPAGNNRLKIDNFENTKSGWAFSNNRYRNFLILANYEKNTKSICEWTITADSTDDFMKTAPIMVCALQNEKISSKEEIFETANAIQTMMQQSTSKTNGNAVAYESKAEGSDKIYTFTLLVLQDKRGNVVDETTGFSIKLK